mmetsp:Transcript_32246/g.55023  ORF Transcript_32246/g.55023 Transcript_32246/m.55023 type:complete len:349 (-) Transcript_32246:132-1178(-)
MKISTVTLALILKASTATNSIVAATAIAKGSDATDRAGAFESVEEEIKRHLRKKGKKGTKINKEKVQESIDKLGFNIYGDSSIFDPSSSIEVDDNCQYTATVRLQLADADVPFPPVMPGPNGPGSCIFEGTDCNGQSCLNEVRNVYSLSEKFEEVTGFNHVGVDWSPCGHPPLEWFGKPHWNLHIFRVTPEERLNARCPGGMLNPFICDFPPFEQPTPEGRAFFVWGKDTNDAVANVPDTFMAATDTAVPGEAVHSWNHNLSVPVAEWFEPQLIMGLYDGGIRFWEPMFPYEFVSGNAPNSYVRTDIEYVSQTIQELPSEYSLSYDPSDGFTTLMMKGHAKGCEIENE